MEQTLLSIRDLRTTFRTQSGVVRAVDGVSFDLAAGQTLGIAGESGSGKSVLVKSIMRVLPRADHTVTTGQIRFDGANLSELDGAQARRYWGSQMAMVFQDPMTARNPVVRIGRQITESLKLHRGMGRSEAEAAAAELLRDVGIPEAQRRMREYPNQLSGGMRQRVTIAIALAGNPRVLIADEPTTALDVTVQRQILDLLSRLQSDRQMAMILVSHDLGVLAGRTDRIVVMYDGRIVESAPTSTLFDQPMHRYTAALMKSRPRMDRPSHERLIAIPGSPPVPGPALDACAFSPRCDSSQDRCDSEAPRLSVADAADHSWACHYPVGSD